MCWVWQLGLLRLHAWALTVGVLSCRAVGIERRHGDFPEAAGWGACAQAAAAAGPAPSESAGEACRGQLRVAGIVLEAAVSYFRQYGSIRLMRATPLGLRAAICALCHTCGRCLQNSGTWAIGGGTQEYAYILLCAVCSLVCFRAHCAPPWLLLQVVPVASEAAVPRPPAAELQERKVHARHWLLLYTCTSALWHLAYSSDVWTHKGTNAIEITGVGMMSSLPLEHAGPWAH